MKYAKHIIALLLVTLLFNCEIDVKFKQSKAFNRQLNFGDNDYYKEERKMIKDMEYLYVYMDYNTSQTGYPIYVVNLTKDSLECEYYKKCIKK